MRRFVLFDSGPLGLAVCRTGTKGLAEFGTRLAELEMAGVTILIPAVIDYEVRRELVRIGATAKLRQLERWRQRFAVLPVLEATWFRAAEFWALSRRMGFRPARTRPWTPMPSWPGARPRSDVRAMR